MASSDTSTSIDTGMFPGIASIGEVEEQLLEQAAVVHAGGLAEQVERDLGADRDVAADADEVDVHELAPGRVTLDLAGEREHARRRRRRG